MTEEQKRRKGSRLRTLWNTALIIAALALFPIGVFVINDPLGLLRGHSHGGEHRVMGDFSAIESALQIYESKSLRLPTTEQGLKALVKKPIIPPIPRNWGRQMDGVPLDPWGVEYRYRSRSIKDPNHFGLISAGPDGIFETADDISNSATTSPGGHP